MASSGRTGDDEVRYAVARGVAHVVLNRPRVLNRFEGRMRESLLELLQRAAADDEVRCIRLTGAPPAFSAGADIDDMLRLHDAGDQEEIRRRVTLGSSIVETIRTIPKPVVAAVDGPAAGAGANLALACDIRLGSERARFVEAFVQIGLMPDWGGVHSLVELVGRGTAADLMMTGVPVEAERALALGMLQRILPAAEFEEASTAYCEHLAQSSGPALAAIKAGLRRAAGDGSAATVAPDIARFEAETQPQLFATDECRAGLEAFLAARAAKREAVTRDA